MQQDTTHIINRLKQQSRHGVGLPDLDDLANTGAAALKTLEALPGIISKIAKSILDTNASIHVADEGIGQFARGLDKVIQINEYLATSVNSIYKSMSILEIRNASINKTFGINSIATAKLSNTYQQISKNLKITNDQTNQYASSIHKLIPTVNQLGKEDNLAYQGLIATQHVLQTQLGLTEELSNSYSLYATQTGKNAATQLQVADEIAKSLDPEGTIGVFNSIVSDIAETTADVQLQFGRIPGELEVASLKAKQLGFSLAQMAKSGDTLLNIESSIGQELEYQLLSGHRLVGSEKAQANLRGRSLTDAYRQATIAGKSADQADILKTILEQEGDVLNNNLIARRQMAELLGTDEATLSRALQKKKLLEQSGIEGIDFTLAGDDLMKALKSANAKSEDIAKIMKSDEHDTRTTNDILAQSLQVALDMKLLMMLEGSDLKNNLKVVEALQKSMKQDATEREKNDAFLALNQKELTQVGMLTLANQKANTLVNAKTQVVATDGSAAMAATPQGTGAMTTAMDTIVPPGFGKRVLTFPEDTLQPPIALSNKDTIFAMTDTAGTASTPTSTPTSTPASTQLLGNTDIMQMAAAIVTAIQQQTQALKQDSQQQTRALKQISNFGEGMNTSYFS